MSKNLKINKENRFYIILIAVGIIATILLYFYTRQFYLSLIPILIAITISFILFFIINKTKEKNTTKKAESLLLFYLGINNQILLGNTIKDSAINALNGIIDENLKKEIQNYLSEDNLGSGVLDISVLNSDLEKELSTLLLYGITHQINSEFKDNFSQLCDMYKEEIEVKKGNKNNAEIYIEYICIGVTFIVSIMLIYKLFKTLL